MSSYFNRSRGVARGGISVAAQDTESADEDARLAERACTGDGAAEEAIYRRHFPYIAGIVLRLMADPAETEAPVRILLQHRLDHRAQSVCAFRATRAAVPERTRGFIPGRLGAKRRAQSGLGLEELIDERTRRNADFPRLVAEAEERRKLARRLTRLREHKSLSQTTVAARMGTSASVVSKLEAGGDIKMSTLQRYCAAMEIADVLDSVVSLMKRHKEGLRAKQIREELGLEAKESPPAVRVPAGRRRVTG